MKIEMSGEQIKSKIIYKLARRGKWMHAHTAEEELIKGFPPYLLKRAKNMIKELRRDQILLAKITKAGMHYSLNIKMKAEIDRLINIFLKMHQNIIL